MEKTGGEGGGDGGRKEAREEGETIGVEWRAEKVERGAAILGREESVGAMRGSC